MHNTVYILLKYLCLARLLVLLVQACLHAPPVMADEAKLAIVFTYFWSRRACVRHPWWRTKRSWPLFSPTFFFLFFLFLFLLGLLLFTHFVESPVTLLFKKFFLQSRIFVRFFCCLRPAFGRGAWITPSPWSIYRAFMRPKGGKLKIKTPSERLNHVIYYGKICKVIDTNINILICWMG